MHATINIIIVLLRDTEIVLWLVNKTSYLGRRLETHQFMAQRVPL